MNTKQIAHALDALAHVKTGFAPIVPVSLLCVLGLLTAAFAPRPAQAAQVLFITNLQSNIVGEYDANTGATINTNFITTPGFGVHYLALDASNHLFVSNGNQNTVGEYNATTGAAINTAFINGQGLNTPFGLALDGNNHLFVANATGGSVGEYNAITGATINATFVNENQGFATPYALAVDRVNNHLFLTDPNNNNIAECDATTGATIKYGFAHLDIRAGFVLDGLNHLFVANDTSVGEYDATTGAAVNANFITGLNFAVGVTLDGNNHLFVTNDVDNTVGEYNATTGATINGALVTGLNEPGVILFSSSVPEPTAFSLLVLAGVGLLARHRNDIKHQ